jgi:hypothetical protein
MFNSWQRSRQGISAVEFRQNCEKPLDYRPGYVLFSGGEAKIIPAMAGGNCPRRQKNDLVIC